MNHNSLHIVGCSLAAVLATSVEAQTPAWLPASALPIGGPTTHDPQRNVVVIVDSVQNRLWEWDGTTFRRVVGAQPGTNLSSTLAWDPLARRILFGNGATWNGANWNNLPMPTGVTQFAAIAVDTARQRIVGIAGAAVHEWDGFGWLRIVPPASPSDVINMVFDPQRGRCVVAAGQAPALLEWDGAEWSEIAPSLPYQGPSFTATLVHDPANARLVLHGLRPTGIPTPVTWQFVNGAWQSLATPAGLITTSRMSFDGVGLLRTGRSSQPREGIWRLEGTVWQLLPPQHPTTRTNPAIASAPGVPGVWMFGGNVGNIEYLDDLWHFDGGWTAIATTSGPSPRRDAAMAWSPVDQAFVLYGGRTTQSAVLDDTWLWNGSTWQQRTPAASPGQVLRLTTDPAGGVVGLAPSTSAAPMLWRWDGSTWTSSVAPATVAWSATDLAHDPSRNVVVVTDSSRLSEWDGTAWRTGPALNSSGTRIGYRPDTQRMVLFGSSLRAEWDGTNLVPIAGTSSSTASLEFAAAVPDHGRRRLWSFRSASSTVTGSFAAHLTTSPHTAERLAYGCSLASSPGVVGDGLPLPGSGDFGLVAETFAPNTPAVLAIGFTLHGAHLGAGCVSWLQNPPAVFVGSTDATGRLRVPLPLPNDPNLFGVAVLAQTAAIDPVHSPLGNLVVSDVLRIILGD